MYEGEKYGLRAHEFREFAAMPVLVDVPFSPAIDIHSSDDVDMALLINNGWQLQSPVTASATTDSYRDFIGSSRAEFAVAKQMYVKSRSGWFSDRSVCYLASGKPVVVQNTAINDYLPIGKGLITFETVDQAVAAIENVEANYLDHCRAAREIAEEIFDSRRVLTALLENLALA
jgi:hypothetical protein